MALRAETRPYLPLPRWAGGRCPWREKPLPRVSLRASAYYILWRYCSKCNGYYCYCMKHINNHTCNGYYCYCMKHINNHTHVQ